jgi:hypothetical protein
LLSDKKGESRVTPLFYFSLSRVLHADQTYLELLNPRREDHFIRKGAETLSSEFYLEGLYRMKIYNFAPSHLGGG